MLEQVPVFGLCKPHDPALWYKDDEGPYYYTLDRVFIKDLKLQVTAGNKLKTDTESDTTFTNIIDEGNAVELPSIKLRITTYDTKKFSYSNVGIRTAVGIRFLSRFINRALHEREINACQIDNGEYAVASEGLCAEEHLVFKYTEQYSNPARALSMTMHGARISPASIMTDKSLGPECKMVPATIKRDYRFNTAQVKLVEKF